MKQFSIPFNVPFFSGNENLYIAEAIKRGQISGNGYFTERCQSFLQDSLRVHKVLLTTSCTHALEMASMLLKIEPGDEIILPSFTFVSTANAFMLRGAKPVFVDVHPDTLNLDETQIERSITRKTKAIVPVHYGGIGCRMDKILEIASSHRIPVVEDNAHGLFGKYQGRFLGSFGDLAALSFHETKNFSCGEGGALILNRDEYEARSEIIREKGTDRSRFFRGEVDKYTWVDLGSSYLPSEILAAFLFAQLEAREKIQNKRKRIWDFYFRSLSGWAKETGIFLPTIPPDCEPAYHLFYLLMPTSRERQSMIEHLKKDGILSVFHYQPLHLSEMGRRFGYERGMFPVTENVSERLLRLPFYNDLSESDLSLVVKSLHSFGIQ